MTAIFTDQFRVEFIRDALWRTGPAGRAAIMIGAGFSRNARPVSPSARPMPSWAQMSQALCNALYAGSTSERREYALREASSTSGSLRLAQEYEAAFGRLALNEQIRNLVPDLEYEPDELHRRLLSLPWTDVFTTNWDTLLERAARDVFQRNYDVIRTSSEIPTASRPRIVKLHGSFPAHEPFIFTEEDYRTYPRIYAPFVNLVQQSLMESVLCLVGFSGDDPNFLHWSGWVRDNLGKNAPKIYLVGWLELSSHRRRMLEERNVVPVDLAALPIAQEWPPEIAHRYASEWFIRALGTKRRFDPLHWPVIDDAPKEISGHLGEIPAPSETLPKPEKLYPDISNKNHTERIAAIREVVDAWAWNRKLYPGWLAAPGSIRYATWMHTYNWISEICRQREYFSAEEFILILGELVWRLDLCLAPYFMDIVQCSEAALQSVDVKVKAKIFTPGGFTASKSSKLVSAWCRIALMLLRSARMDGKLSTVPSYQAVLEECAIHDPEIANELTYEKCLWYRDKGDFSALEATIQVWNVSRSDAAWAIKKSGLLANIGDIGGAESHFKNALTEIRRNRRRDCVDISAYSREGWALWYQAAIENALLQRSTDMMEGPKPTQRWLELGIYSCNGLSEYEGLVTKLERSARKPRPGMRQVRRFDLGDISSTMHLGVGIEDYVRHSYEMLRLAEVTGIPHSFNRVKLFEDGIQKAVTLLQDSEPWWCVIWSVQAAQSASDDALKFFSRERIARLENEHVNQLSASLQAEIDFALNRNLGTSDESRYWSGRLAVVVEILSRLTLRFNEEQAKQIIQLATSFASHPKFQRDGHLHKPLGRLLQRGIESVPRPYLGVVLVDLFGLLLVSPTQPNDTDWPEVAEILPQDLVFQRTDVGRDSRWNLIIHQLISSWKAGNNLVKGRALHRLIRLHEFGVLNQEEQTALANAIWDADNIGPNDWPKNFFLKEWAILLFPETRTGQAQQAFRGRFLSAHKKLSPQDAANTITAVGNALILHRTRQADFQLSTEERDFLLAAVIAWAEQPLEKEVDPLAKFFTRFSSGGNEYDVLVGLIEVLEVLELPSDTARLIWEKSSQQDEEYLNKAVCLRVALLRFIPDCSEILEKELRKLLVSREGSVCAAGCYGLYQWVFLHRDKCEIVPAPHTDLIREVGYGVAVRRLEILRPGLEFATALIREEFASYYSHLIEHVLHGMEYLIEEAKYDGPLAKDEQVDLPILRYRCVMLAIAIMAAELDRNNIAGRWLEIANADRMPEVRNALSNFGTEERPIIISS